MAIAGRDLLGSIHQDLLLNPLLDSLLVRSPAKVIIQTAEMIARLPGKARFGRRFIKTDLPLQPVNPDARRGVNLILIPCEILHFLEDLVLYILDEIYQPDHIQFNLINCIQDTKNI